MVTNNLYHLMIAPLMELTSYTKELHSLYILRYVRF